MNEITSLDLMDRDMEILFQEQEYEHYKLKEMNRAENIYLDLKSRMYKKRLNSLLEVGYVKGKTGTFSQQLIYKGDE